MKSPASAVVVNLEDISPSGARVQTDEPIPIGAEVELHCGARVYTGVVRYCLASSLGQDLGIQFTPSGAWKATEFAPKHLFDPGSMKRA